MKIILFAQFVSAILLTIAAIGMMIGAFINDAAWIWKAFTLIIFLFSVNFIKSSHKELKS